MRFVDPLVSGVLLGRRKRFFADVQLDDGERVVAHCANTGTMKTCAEPGWRVLLSPARNPKRKLAWTWEVVYAGDGTVPVLVNTARPNHVVREAIVAGRLPALSGYARVRSEVRYGARSRVDLLLEDHPSHRRCWVEVKNLTLLVGPGVGAFPDAVTVRGRKHLGELTAMVRAGDRAAQVFLVPRSDIQRVRPADEIDPAYGLALREAVEGGVELYALRARVDAEQVVGDGLLPIDLSL